MAVAVLVGTVGATVGASTTTAGADPIGDKRAQAKALTLQIVATNAKIEALGEQYNGAEYHFEQAQAALAAAQAKVDATEADIAQLKALVAKRAASVYRRAIGGQLDDSLSFDNASRAMARKQYAASQARHDAQVLSQLHDAKVELAHERDAAARVQADADAERQKIASLRKSLETANASQQQLLSQTQGEIAQLVKQEMQRLQAEAAAMARSSFRNSNENFPNLGPPGSAASVAIAFAKLQIGKTYVYAAVGPDHYDCSGLVMTAFAQAGVHLPHYSGAQYDLLPHVRLDAMQPGDLVFWGTGGSEHVAIYLGAGQIIESGGTGHDVHIGPIWGHPWGAARVTA
jgi:peptidoglycan DL-endopeptidase CwlO